MAQILIAEDDSSVGRFLEQALQETGRAVLRVEDGLHAYHTAKSTDLDLILLDVMLPGLDGFEICRRLRADSISTPILLITARDSVQDKIIGLDSGADDYIVKPFQLDELMARIRALLRRSTFSPALLHVGDLSLDPATRKATRAGRSIMLSATEYSLLEYLMRNRGRVLTRAMILDHVWQYDFNGSDNVLDVYINYLRNKVDRGTSQPLIQTVRGVGYTMDTDASA